MESFNASVPDESKSQLAVEGRSLNQKGQCTPMQSPSLGTLKLVAGNGTSVGTVMTLQCPYAHRAIRGGRVTCMQDSNRTHWSGGVPECKPLSLHESHGFRVAIFASIVSVAIIIFMSVIFITSCLLKHVKREETRRQERKRNEEAAKYWAQLDHQHLEEQRLAFQSHKGGNDNNNNNNNSSGSSRLEQHTQHTVAAACIQHPCSNLPDAYRCLPEILRTSSTSKLLSVPEPSAALHENIQMSCALQSHNTHLQTDHLCSPYDHTLEVQPQNRPLPVPADAQNWFAGPTGQALESLEDPLQKCPVGPQSPPVWVISV